MQSQLKKFWGEQMQEVRAKYVELENSSASSA